MRVPTISWWPGTIPAGTSCDQISTKDGKDISPLIMNEANAQSPYEAFFYYDGDLLEGVRSGKWKLRLGALYNLNEDIAEKKDVSSDNPEIVQKLERLLEEMKQDLEQEENCRAPGYVEHPQYLVPLPE